MISAEKKSVRKQRKVPEFLIYELMDGKPIYYRGYKSVLNNTKKFEDIMGSSSLQSVIIIHILSILLKSLNEEEFWIMTNETGIHLDHRNNLSGDILIYEKSRLKASDINTHYTKAPSNIAIEVDTKADLSILTFQKYMKLKTTKLHHFGVDKVIWIMTATKQVIVALPNQDWLIIDWNKDIEIMRNLYFNIGNYLQKSGIELQEDL
jgi:Uma2 family endonuclease